MTLGSWLFEVLNLWVFLATERLGWPKVAGGVALETAV